jgi:hypothetical protein
MPESTTESCHEESPSHERISLESLAVSIAQLREMGIRFLPNPSTGQLQMIIDLSLPEDIKKFLPVIASRMALVAGLSGQGLDGIIFENDSKDNNELKQKVMQTFNLSQTLHRIMGYPIARTTTRKVSPDSPKLNMFPMAEGARLDGENLIFDADGLNGENKANVVRFAPQANEEWIKNFDEVKAVYAKSGLNLDLVKQVAEELVPQEDYKCFDDQAGLDEILRIENREGIVWLKNSHNYDDWDVVALIKINDTASGDGVMMVPQIILESATSTEEIIEKVFLYNSLRKRQGDYNENTVNSIQEIISKNSKDAGYEEDIVQVLAIDSELGKDFKEFCNIWKDKLENGGVLSKPYTALNGKERSITFADRKIPEANSQEEDNQNEIPISIGVVAGTINYATREGVHIGNVLQKGVEGLQEVLKGTKYKENPKEFVIGVEAFLYHLCKKMGVKGCETFERFRQTIQLPFIGIDIRFDVNQNGEIVIRFIDLNTRVGNPAYPIMTEIGLRELMDLKNRYFDITNKFDFTETGLNNIQQFLRLSELPQSATAQMRYTLDLDGRNPEEVVKEIAEKLNNSKNAHKIVVEGISVYNGKLLFAVAVVGSYPDQAMKNYMDIGKELGLEYYALGISDLIIDKLLKYFQLKALFHSNGVFAFNPITEVHETFKFEDFLHYLNMYRCGKVEDPYLILNIIEAYNKMCSTPIRTDFSVAASEMAGNDYVAERVF